MNPETSEKKVGTAKTTPETQEINQELINKFKISEQTENKIDAMPATETKVETPVEVKKMGIMDRLKNAFKPSEKEQRIAEMKKKQEEQILSSLSLEQKAKYQAFRNKYGYDAYAQWDSEAGDYKTPHSDTANRGN